LAVLTLKDLLESGVHFGHQTKRWNPKMKRFIFEERNGIYIINLQKTMSQLQKACNFIQEIISRGEEILFVGTKKQAKEAIYNAATHCEMHYVNERWLGGTLTNNATIRKSINRLIELENMVAEGTMELLPKKEVASLMREKTKLHRNLDGIKNMKRLPGVVFIIDTKRENIASAEAVKLKIPIVAVLDTNSDPDPIDYVIPANDDAIKSIGLMCSIIADVVIEAAENYKQNREIQLKTEKPKETRPPARTARNDRRRPPSRTKTARRPQAVPKKKVVVVRKETVSKDKPEEQPKTKTAPEKPITSNAKQGPDKAKEAKAKITKPAKNQEKEEKST